MGFADFEIFIETFIGSGSSKRLAINDTSTAAVERAFIGLGKFCIQSFCDNEVEHGVAQEFEALVVATNSLATGVGKGEFEQRFILEIVLSNRFVRHFTRKVVLIGFTACPKVERAIKACCSPF